MKKLVLLFVFINVSVFAQTGVIRGKITDKQSDKPIQGAKVIVVSLEKNIVSSDSLGNYKITGVTLGRQVVEISYIGYEGTTIPDIDVTTGKDNVINAALIENLHTLQEVIINSGSNKAKAINKMTTVSVRQFTLEEVNRYAGGRSDVARLATNFAGVATADDSRNDIIVRGNSPTGLLWRLEGIPIPSPNHFSSLGTTGSPVSALNPNLLANSDFLTSAFPAEYGNALGGVFDLGFRKGNTEEYEYMVSIGAYPGLEAMAEGPLGKTGGSFVAAVRYGIAGLLGLGGTNAQPNYNDLSFNIDFGKSKLGTFSLFGIYGDSNIDLIGKDIDKDDLFAAEDEDSYITSGFNSFGLKHNILIGEQSFLKTIISTSNTQETYKNFRYFDFDTFSENRLQYKDVDNIENRFTFSTLFNSKISKKFIIRTGLLFENYKLKATISDRDRQEDNNGDGYPDFVTLINTNENYNIVQPYIQGQFRLSEKFSLNAGLHCQYFSLNEAFVIEPRGSISYTFNQKNTLNFGYGLHHQNVAAPLLFLNENVNGTLVQTNKNLDLVQSQHFVLGYDIRLANKWRGKIETYYQIIDKAAVERTISSYSSLTEGASFIYSTDKHSLVSNGKGHNTGIEFTLEKFFSKGYHGLFTSSFFESKYKGSDNIERNTPFNNGYVINVLAGKEFKIGKDKRNVFSIDTKITTAGGKYYTPIDLAASNVSGYEIRDDANAFSKQYDAYLRMDIKLGMKFNNKKKKGSHQFYIDFQNVTDNENVYSRNYNRLTNSVNQKNQIGFAPDFGYKFQF